MSLKLNDAFINNSEYWRGLAAVTGASLKQRLRVIHADIVNIWFKGNVSFHVFFHIPSTVITIVILASPP